MPDLDADADLSGYDVLIVGKAALTPDGPGPNVDSVRNGLKVIVFEQVAGAGRAFWLPRGGIRSATTCSSGCRDHPTLAGLDVENLRDWRGEATLLPPRLNTQ